MVLPRTCIPTGNLGIIFFVIGTKRAVALLPQACPSLSGSASYPFRSSCFLGSGVILRQTNGEMSPLSVQASLRSLHEEYLLCTPLMFCCTKHERSEE